MRECDFIEEIVPLAIYPDLLDLACSSGRHSLELAARGYHVTGVDIDTKVLQVATERAQERKVMVEFIAADLRDMSMLRQHFDGILLFWQSFGFFDGAMQMRIFADLHRMLRPGGRLLIDIYNRLHFSGQRGRRKRPEPEESLPFWKNDLEISAPLSYEEDLRFEHQRAADLFDPHLFSPGEIAGIAANHHLHLIASCSNFHQDTAATPDHPRMQLIFQSMPT